MCLFPCTITFLQRGYGTWAGGESGRMSKQCGKRGIRDKIEWERSHVINSYVRWTTGIISEVGRMIILGCSFMLI